MSILDMKRYFLVLIILKNISNLVIKLFIFGNVREVIEKLLNIVNIFGI